ncbi:hypothetical protein WG66_005336 [Moniliophthora roreri]|nr:hypothetical protein WG66_005336 [Moniliophthora roreri]
MMQRRELKMESTTNLIVHGVLSVGVQRAKIWIYSHNTSLKPSSQLGITEVRMHHGALAIPDSKQSMGSMVYVTMHTANLVSVPPTSVLQPSSDRGLEIQTLASVRADDKRSAMGRYIRGGRKAGSGSKSLGGRQARIVHVPRMIIQGCEDSFTWATQINGDEQQNE